MLHTIKKVQKVALESFSFWGGIMPQLLMISAKTFLMHTPLLIFWLMLIAADFNGALFLDELQKITKEAITAPYLVLGTGVLSLNFFVEFFLKPLASAGNPLYQSEISEKNFIKDNQSASSGLSSERGK